MHKKELSHINKNGEAQMVDVSSKTPSLREARARAVVYLPKEVQALTHNNDLVGKKGPVFQTAKLAGIMAAKKTFDLIPLCHPLALSKIELTLEVREDQLSIESEVACVGVTGVEMEALTAVSVAALTVYDMCKAASHEIVIKEIKLLSKSGGKNDFTAQ
jgi:cyclic pyranopterin monophosphate synthase